MLEEVREKRLESEVSMHTASLHAPSVFQLKVALFDYFTIAKRPLALHCVGQHRQIIDCESAYAAVLEHALFL